MKTETAVQRIRQLPDALASRIAAGEVVERPAAVVKELVENALDAGARRVEIEVAGGGLELICVSDDGRGIDPEQLELAFARHATSKLAEGDSLFAIGSLGFRGEALPSIAAVAEVELVSRLHGEDAGAAVLYRFGEMVRKTAKGAAAGTSVRVRRLFAQQPARLKFLRSRASEYQQIAAVAEHYALARTDIAFRLVIDGRQALLTAGDGDGRRALAAVYGHELARQMLPAGPYSDRGVAIEGWIAPPHLTRSTRQDLSLFVNGRWVLNRRLLFALDDAFQGLMPRGRHPIAVIFVDLPLDEVDVNAHPTKAEVRFRDEGAIFGVLQKALRQALSSFAPAPTMTGGWPVSEEAAYAVPSGAPGNGHLFDGPPVQFGAPAFEEGATQERPTVRSRLPLLRVLGQMGTTYVVAEGPDGMYLIDQHTAHERVLFDQIAARGESPGDVQALLVPVPVELSPAQVSALKDFSAELALSGFQLDEIDGGAYMLRCVPGPLAGKDPAAGLSELLSSLIDDAGAPDRRWKVRATLACHAAVRAGMTLTQEEMRELISQLEACEEPLACPHGRPALVHLPVEALDRQFGRNWR
ncbi:MAG: DNA mismatch repair endonuclease MutL [Dehalococcoidia bacterium]